MFRRTYGSLNDDDFTGPLPIIGVYIAGASLVCFLLMFLDLLYGFRGKIPWFPSTFFALNSATLTLISIATKLPVDLNTSMPSREDQLSKLSGTVMICTMMANFMPSLGAMGDSELCSNFIAVALLVITVTVNVCIQISTGVIYVFLPEHVIVLFFMLLLLLLLGISASTVPTARQILNQKYDSKREKSTRFRPYRQAVTEEAFRLMKKLVEESWIMEHSKSPKHVLKSSETSNGAGVFSLLSALVLAEALFRSGSMSFCNGTSDYGSSTWVILISQSLVVVLSIIGPILRWLIAIKMKMGGGGQSFLQLVLTVDYFGVERLVEWKRSSSLPFHIPWRLGRLIFHCLKYYIMSFFILAHRVVVLVSKFYGLVVVSLLRLVTLPKSFCKKLATDSSHLDAEDQTITSTGIDHESQQQQYNLRNFVFHLDGEKDLAPLIFKTGFRALDKWISRGRKNKPEYLIKLLEEKSTPSDGFKCAIEFDSDAVTSLFIQRDEDDFFYKCFSGNRNGEITKKVPNCWALPIATLTSIAISLPYSDKQRMNLLLKGVSQGLEFVRFIEKYINRTELMNMRKAAEDVWLSVDLYRRWLDIDLLNNHNAPGPEARTVEHIINKFSQNVEKHVVKYKEMVNEFPKEWSTKVVAANSMYRICKTILLDPDKFRTMDNLINWLEKTVSDLLCDCLFNLPLAVFRECLYGRVEDREAQIRNTALMFGAVQHLQQLLTRSTPANSRLFATNFDCVRHETYEVSRESGSSAVPTTIQTFV